ncbi:hypothetical protein N5923_08770 [Erwiniaceae bacterium BAC15a-03b]|uniref:Uncharacterized protein n=1 Tax=Winslowiella arboricola TaxID=2978220 RepID=A0A9J6PU73_9GAMM|nr:hypothetical protein [Winslowiella arboricola]MCU5771746.1 hypothetical protein [Winslowiella arboricola]MCU5777583.1 hypothetical protein [Winslowiella arboricola]
MNRKAIEILNKIISDSERDGKEQGNALYKLALKVLHDENASEVELRSLYINFCGYIAHGDFTYAEYNNITKLID